MTKKPAPPPEPDQVIILDMRESLDFEEFLTSRRSDEHEFGFVLVFEGHVDFPVGERLGVAFDDDDDNVRATAVIKRCVTYKRDGKTVTTVTLAHPERVT